MVYTLLLSIPSLRVEVFSRKTSKCNDNYANLPAPARVEPRPGGSRGGALRSQRIY